MRVDFGDEGTVFGAEEIKDLTNAIIFQENCVTGIRVTFTTIIAKDPVRDSQRTAYFGNSTGGSDFTIDVR